MRFPYSKAALVLIIGIILVAAPVHAQNNPTPAPNSTCNQIQQRVVTTLAQFCSTIDKNTACYASNQVVGTPIVPTDNFFSQPGAKQLITDFKDISTSGVDPTSQNWGIAALNLGILSNSQDDVEVLLTGSARLEPVASTNETSAASNAFFFNTQDSSCSEAPSTVSIRVPDNVTIKLTVNGALMTIGSTVMLRTVAPGNVMRLMTIKGNVSLQSPGGAAPVSIPTGYVSDRCLGQPQSLGVDGQANDQSVYDSCGWTSAALASADDNAIATSVEKVFDGLAGVVCANGGQTYIHVVSRGENLFRIARRYSKTVQQVAADNGISNANAIFVGQQLTITCGIDLHLSTQAPAVSFPTTAP
jgi:LysM repeat protein